jgi:hypothetical protein
MYVAVGVSPQGDLFDETVSILRSISGQHLSPESGTRREFPLPWEGEKRLAPFLRHRDRGAPDQRFIYEWGRASDIDGRGLFKNNMAMMAYLTARNVILQGGHLEEARVEIHSTTAGNTAKYLSERYGFALMGDPVHRGRRHDAVLYQPVLELLRRFPPWNLLPQLRLLLNASGSRGVEDAIRSYERTRSEAPEWRELSEIDRVRALRYHLE